MSFENSGIEKLFNFTNTFDANFLDEVVQAAYNAGPQQKLCMDALEKFQSHPEAWNTVDLIVERCKFPQSKFIGLAIMEKLIQTRWKTIPNTQKEAIKNFLIQLLIKNTSTAENISSQKIYIRKLDLIIVQLLKQEWPLGWPDFIPELISSSRSNLTMCENNMRILKYMSEEIFDFSENSLTQIKIKTLKTQMESEFTSIFQLCLEVLSETEEHSLILSTLEALLGFLNWIPLNFVFDSDLLNILCNRFLPVPSFRNITIKCITQIGGQKGPNEYDQKFLLLFNIVLASIKQTIPIDLDLATGYANGNDEEQEYVQNIALFLTSFLERHIDLIEKEGNKPDVVLAHRYLVLISEVNEREVFKICLDYWIKFLSELFNEIKLLPTLNQNSVNIPEIGAPPTDMFANFPLRKHSYSRVLQDLRSVMIDRMVRPEEVLIVENEDGEVVREFTKETDTVTLYKSMREALVYLTHLDVVDTEEIMTKKLCKQVEMDQFNRAKLNCLCWSIGSISGAMHESTEKRFLVVVIKDLLGLCELSKGKDNKAIVASNIMYIVGQYPRFLRAHWKFLKTVTNKLFEFMHEIHEGVKDMACDTFMQIATSCKRHFVSTNAGEHYSLIDTIEREVDYIIKDLNPAQQNCFFEACGEIIAVHPNPQTQIDLIMQFLAMTNNQWVGLVQNSATFDDQNAVKALGNCLKTFTAMCRGAGAAFTHQLALTYNDLLGLFKSCSEVINVTLASMGPVAMQTPKVRYLRTVRKESLRLLETYISKSNDLKTISQDLIPPLIETYLITYKNSLPKSREAEVLDLFSMAAEKLGPLLDDKVMLILDSILEPTMNMLQEDITEYPDIRISLFKLLKNIVANCFNGLMAESVEGFNGFMFTLMYGHKHTLRDISEMSLETVTDVFKNVCSTNPNFRDQFCSAYIFPQLHSIMNVLFDGEHKNGFHIQCKTICQLILHVKNDLAHVPLQYSAPRQPNMSNSEYLKIFLNELVSTSYSHLNQNIVEAFSEGLILYADELAKCKLFVRDFLISIKEFGNDNSDLFLADREQELLEKQARERELALQVPGMIKPSELLNMED